MLGKLIKYEFKATGRSLLLLYGVLLLISIVNRGFFKIGVSTEEIELTSNAFFSLMKFLSIVLYVILFVAVNVLTLIVIIQRFYKNLLKDEGYLMNTLPVKPSMNIMSKLVVATAWATISAIVSGLSIMILAYDKYAYGNLILRSKETMDKVLAEFGAGTYLIILEVIIIILLCTVLSVLAMYCSMLIGHLFNKHKVSLSFAAFSLINIILNILFAFMAYFSNNVLGIQENSSMMFYIQYIMFLMFGYFGITSLVVFYISTYIMKNRLNLE